MMISDTRASLYIGVTLLICGCFTFLSGLSYLTWLVINKPSLI